MTAPVSRGQAALLRVAAAGPLTADNAEAGHDAVCRESGIALAAAEFHDAVRAAVAAGLLREPIRLEAGGLHCHWTLELTQTGRAAAQRLTGD